MNKFPEVKCQFKNECFEICWLSFIDSHQRSMFLNRKPCLYSYKHGCFKMVRNTAFQNRMVQHEMNNMI